MYASFLNKAMQAAYDIMKTMHWFVFQQLLYLVDS